MSEDCKQANNNSASEATHGATSSCSRGLAPTEEQENIRAFFVCFTVHINNIHLLLSLFPFFLVGEKEKKRLRDEGFI